MTRDRHHEWSTEVLTAALAPRKRLRFRHVRLIDDNNCLAGLRPPLLLHKASCIAVEILTRFPFEIGFQLLCARASSAAASAKLMNRSTLR